MFEADEIAGSTDAKINDAIARTYSAAGPGFVKTADDKIKAFLTMLSKEMSLKLHLPVTEIRKCAERGRDGGSCCG
jgi:hypothetical protein